MIVSRYIVENLVEPEHAPVKASDLERVMSGNVGVTDAASAGISRASSNVHELLKAKFPGGYESSMFDVQTTSGFNESAFTLIIHPQPATKGVTLELSSVYSENGYSSSLIVCRANTINVNNMEREVPSERYDKLCAKLLSLLKVPKPLEPYDPFDL